MQTRNGWQAAVSYVTGEVLGLYSLYKSVSEGRVMQVRSMSQTRAMMWGSVLNSRCFVFQGAYPRRRRSPTSKTLMPSSLLDDMVVTVRLIMRISSHMPPDLGRVRESDIVATGIIDAGWRWC